MKNIGHKIHFSVEVTFIIYLMKLTKNKVIILFKINFKVGKIFFEIIYSFISL